MSEKLTERKEWDALYLLLLSALIGQSCCRGYQCKENNSSADFSKSWEEKLNEDFPHSRCRPTLRNVSGNFSLSNQTHAISSPKKTFFLLQDKWTHETNDNNCVDTRVIRKINYSTTKLRAYPHAHLQVSYNSDPKAFFLGTSLKGPSTWWKMEDFYIVDFHSDSSWPGQVKAEWKSTV